MKNYIEYELTGTLSESNQHTESNIAMTYGSSYYSDITLDSVSINKNNTFTCSLYIEKIEGKNEDEYINEIHNILQENITHGYTIDIIEDYNISKL